MHDALVTHDAADLATLETRIQACLESVAELGRLLLVVNRRRLYRDTFSTFEAYCWERWRIGRHRAYQLISAGQTSLFLLTNGQQLLPENERQYRELGKLPLAERLLVWQQALEGEGDAQPAAAAIAALIAERVAGLTPAEQLAAIGAYEKNLLAAGVRPPAPPNWPRRAGNVRRNAVLLRAQCPDVVAEFGDERMERLVAELEALEAVVLRRRGG